MLPVEIVVEKAALQRMPEIRDKLSLGRSCLVVDDVNTRSVAGLSIIDALKEDGCQASEVVVDRPDEANVKKVVEALGRECFLIGVGGTSVLDVAKLAAHRKGVRYILFSTGMANSGIISATSSIYVGDRKESIPVTLADAVVVDLSIVSRAPDWMVAAGCGDLLIEATAIKDWQLGRDEVAESYCDSIAELEMSTLDYILHRADSIKARTEDGIEFLVDALIVSGLGMAIWGSSRPSSGSEHLWSHWLDHFAEENGMTFGRHGEQVGVGTLLMAKYHEYHNPNWWDKTLHPNYQAQALRSFLRKIGGPTTPAEIGVSRDLTIRALLSAREYRRERYTILHKRPPNVEDAERVMKELGM